MSHLDHTGTQVRLIHLLFVGVGIYFWLQCCFKSDKALILMQSSGWSWLCPESGQCAQQPLFSSVSHVLCAQGASCLLAHSFLPLKIYGILTNCTFHGYAVDCYQDSLEVFWSTYIAVSRCLSFIQSGVYFPAGFLFVFELRFMIGFYWVLSQNIRLLFS